MLKTYIVENLIDAREFLCLYHKKVILTNKVGSTKYYGILVLDYMFKQLLKEFPQITKIIIEVGDDHAALFSAVKLGYKNIIYTGNSEEARRMLHSIENQ